jgi:long-chain acyl-CoA synthetase
MEDSFLKRVIDSFEARASLPAMRIVGDDSQVYTFGESLQAVRSLAYRIGEESVAFGDHVALIGENHPCWALSYLGVLYRGAVCVPLDPHGELETITNFLENSEAKLAFIGAEFKEQFKIILEKLGRHIPAVVWEKEKPQRGEEQDERFSSESQNGNQNGFHHFSGWAATEIPETFAREVPKAKRDDTALLIYTSGTTGVPKGVPLTHGNIVAELDGINEVLKLTDEETILSLLPLFHAYLQIVNLWVATTYGCQVGYLKELSPAELSAAMAEFKPTILTTVPRLWYLFHKKIFDAVEAKPKAVQMLFRSMLSINGVARDVFRVNLGRVFFGKVHDGFGGKLRLAISAGSRFDQQVARDFHKLGFTIIQGYGLTETSGAATATYENDNRIGSVGKPMFNAELKIDAPDAEGVGEVLLRGEMVFDGYYKNPAATAEAFTGDGWFRSGDLGRIDKDGHLYIVGRAKDVIVLPSGKNVHPEDLEVHYLKAPEVEELAVLGVRDDTESRAGAEKLIAVVVPDFEYLKHAKIANSKEAIRYALDNLGRELPEYQRVRDYIVRAEALPRTATRKIKRFQLQKEIERGTLSLGAPETKTWEMTAEETALIESPLARTVVNTIRPHASQAEMFHPEMNLEIDLGLDSLARAEVFAALEHAFEAEFTAEQAAAAITIKDVVALVRGTPVGTKLDAERTSGIALKTDLNWNSIIRNSDEDLPEVRGILKHRILFPAFAFFVYRCFNLFCRLFMRLEVDGVENLTEMANRVNAKNTKSGLSPFLICPNHQSFLDPFVLCSTYPFHIFRNIFHVGAKMFFQTALMRFIAKMLNVVPIDQDTQLMRAMKAGAIGLKNGKILNIYPEGERAFDGNLHEFKKGAAILATEMELPIVPVALDGLQNVWARRSWRIRPAKVRIRIGSPFFPNDLISKDNDAEANYEMVISHLKNTIAEMIAEMRS